MPEKKKFCVRNWNSVSVRSNLESYRCRLADLVDYGVQYHLQPRMNCNFRVFFYNEKSEKERYVHFNSYEDAEQAVSELDEIVQEYREHLY